MKLIINVFILLFYFQSQSEIELITFFEGTWKIENKQSYEVWEKENATTFKGYSYKIIDGNEVIQEYLKIEFRDNQLFYTAKVLNQNNQKEIEFILNPSIKGKLSFENLKHDFPKKIQYKKLNFNQILVEVLGVNDKGFSFKMTKQ